MRTHRRSSSTDTASRAESGAPALFDLTNSPHRLPLHPRTVSQESIEVLVTPVDEYPRDTPFMGSSGKATTSPPSPSALDGKLASFLRERTSGRLANSARPKSMPPSAYSQEALRFLAGQRPILRVTPPPLDMRPHPALPPAALTSPVRSSFASHSLNSPTEMNFVIGVAGRTVTTPPRRGARPTSPGSPTCSVRSSTSASSASPSLSVPIITCTPAPQRTIKDGVEQDSDQEEGDVIVFDGEAEAEEQDEDKEREGRAEEMKRRLAQRRGSG